MKKNVSALSLEKAMAAFSRPGARLMTMHTRDGTQFFVIPGGPVSDADAAALLTRANVERFDDGLFTGCPQSWRIVS